MGDAGGQLRTLLPDDFSPAAFFRKNPPLLSEIEQAVRDHYQIIREDQLTRSPARGLIIVLARYYTRTKFAELAERLGINHGNASAQYNKTIGRLDANELLRDDRDIIERRLATLVMARTGGQPCP